jgi:hypothetical protein
VPDISLVDYLLAPPLGVLEPVLDTRSPWLEGSHSISTTYDGTPVADTFGCIIAATGIPIGWGYDVGYKDVSEGLDARRFVPFYCQLVTVHRLFDGSPVFSQVVYIDQGISVITWDVALPSLVGLYLQPGWEIDLYWLRAL